ncbi:hypothetical protein GCM10023169_30010 [Georgenia halophila]|uniref:Uncharacterized protein n=1 Tax=Georgenia halophila TaxID=620889 RepID=A0ABP8LGS5_9MICO
METSTPAPSAAEVTIGTVSGREFDEVRHEVTCSSCGVLGNWLLHSSAQLERDWHLLSHNQHAVTVQFDIEEWTRITQAVADLLFTPVDLIRRRALRPEPTSVEMS